MPKINYQFSDEHYEEIEVTEAFAQAYEEIDKQTKRNDKKFDWRTRNKESSLEKLHAAFECRAHCIYARFAVQGIRAYS